MKKLPELTASPLPSFLDHMAALARASFKIDYSFKYAKEFVKESALNKTVSLCVSGGDVIVTGAYAVGGKIFILRFGNKWLKSYVLANEPTEERYQ